jgi:Zn-dependent peptidase ImmA (M78 family)
MSERELINMRNHNVDDPILVEYFAKLPGESSNVKAVRELFVALIAECPSVLGSQQKLTTARAFAELRRARFISRGTVAQDAGVDEVALGKWELDIGMPAGIFSSFDTLVCVLLSRQSATETSALSRLRYLTRESSGAAAPCTDFTLWLQTKVILDKGLQGRAEYRPLSEQKRNWYRSISHRADKLIADYMTCRALKSIPVPVPVDLISEVLLRVDYFLDPMESGLSGWFDPRDRRISVNSKESPSRCRYTLAHEVGHAWLHAPKLEGAVHRDVTETISEQEESIQPEDLLEMPMLELIQAKAEFVKLKRRAHMETEANVFAGCLLMPFQALTDCLQAGVCDLGELADIFQVSRAAMRWRLLRLDVCVGKQNVSASGQQGFEF